jgi:VCBS repeat-containing protein
VAVDYSFAIGKKDILTVTAASGLLSQDSTPVAGDVLVVDPSQTDAVSVGGAQVLVRPDGSFQYDPTQAFPSLGAGKPYSDTFTYVIVDSFGATSQATVHIAVTGVEDTPVAPDYDITSGFWTPSDGSLSVDAAHGLLSKAYSPDTGVTSQLTAFGKGNSTLGATVTVNPDGSFTYDPTNSQQIQQLTAQGQDVVDAFSYGVKDPNGPVVDPTVVVVVKSGHPEYSYDLVGSMQRDKFTSLGAGPSINDQGNVAFEGVDGSKKDSPYIWTAPAGNGTADITPSPVLNPGFLFLAPTADTNQSIYETFGPDVQINNQDEILTQRVLAAGGLVGTLPGGIPAVVSTNFLLSYSEVYFGGNALAKSYPIPYQVSVADSGISAAGIQWGNPLFKDMVLAGLAGVIGFSSIAGGAATTESLTNLMLLPRAWIGGPLWGSLFLSPVDQNWTPVFWKTSSQGIIPATIAAADFALALSIGPNATQLRLKDVDDFSVIYPSLALSDGPPVPGSPGDYFSFNPGHVAFTSMGTTRNNLANFLVTANHGSVRELGIQTNGFVAAPKIADDGTTVVSTGDAVHLLQFNDLSDPNPITIGNGPDFIGPYPSVSRGTDPWVAFAARSAKLGDGIFAADVANPSKWYKIAGVSNDGHLDPNDKWVDANNNGKYDKGEDSSNTQRIDLNGRIGISKNGLGELTISFFANVLQPDGKTQYSLQTVQFVPPGSKLAPQGPLEPVDPANTNPHILPRFDYFGSTSVVTVGDILPGAGTVRTIKTFDPINNQGQVVFWVQTDQNIQAVIRANPILPKITVQNVTTDDSRNVTVKYNVLHNDNKTPFTIRIYRAYRVQYQKDRSQQVLVAEAQLTPTDAMNGDHEIVIGPEGDYDFSQDDPLRPDPTHEYVIATADDDGRLNPNDVQHAPQQEFRIWIAADVTHGFNESGPFSDVPDNLVQALRTLLVGPLPLNKLTLILFNSALYGSTRAAWLDPMRDELRDTPNSGHDAAIDYHWEQQSATNSVPGRQLDFLQPPPTGQNGQYWTRFSGNQMDQQLIESIPGMLPGFDADKDVVDVHFIGHSRGGVVISEALQDLNGSAQDSQWNIQNVPHWLSAGYPMMTLLDPHPANNQLWPTPIDPSRGTNYGSLSDAFDEFLHNHPEDQDILLPFADAVDNGVKALQAVGPILFPLLNYGLSGTNPANLAALGTALGLAAPGVGQIAGAFLQAYNRLTARIGKVLAFDGGDLAFETLFGYIIVVPVRNFQAQAQDDNVIIPSNVRIAEEYYQKSISTENTFDDKFEASVDLWGELPQVIDNQAGVPFIPDHTMSETTSGLNPPLSVGHGEIPGEGPMKQKGVYQQLVEDGGVIAFFDTETGGQPVYFPITLRMMGLHPFSPGDPLVVTSQPPTSVTPGSPFGLVVTAENENGTVNTSFEGPITLSLTGRNTIASLGGALTVTAVNGVAKFSGLTVSQTGNGFEIVASSPYLPYTPTSSFNVVLPDSSPSQVAPPGQLGQIANQITHSTEHYQDFVTTAYQTYLGRKPDVSGLNAWVSAMQAGMTDEQLEATFISSPEYIANHGGSGAGWVTGMYRDLLGRTPAGAEVNGWVQAMSAGATPRSVALGFAASAEREAARVRQDYQTLLGRTPEAAEVAAWVSAFTGGLTNEGLVAGFLASSEYYNNPAKGNGDNRDWITSATSDVLTRVATTDEMAALEAALVPSNLAEMAGQITHSAEHFAQFITTAYQKYLGRTPDDAGLAFWVSLMRAGLSDEQLEAKFIGSPEYIAQHGGNGAGWVRGLYHDLLGRNATDAEVSGWVNALNRGVSTESIAFGFASSPEREAMRIRDDYFSYLGRDASQGEIDFWVKAFGQGLSDEDLAANFIASPEYYDAAAKGRSDKADWLASVISDTLGRNVTASELRSLGTGLK